MWGLVGLGSGVHRLWCHRGYEADTPVRVLLMLCWTLMGGSTVNNWCVHHRVHHKFSDTDGDPHNITRGVFYCHIGWSMMYPHPEYLYQKSKMAPKFKFLKDPVVKFNQDYYFFLVVALNAIVVSVPIMFWSESIWHSFLVSYVIRSVTSYHCGFLVNSAAHLYGNRPYDESIKPAQNTSVAFCAIGEGYHNYHHAFPYDYGASEDGVFFNYSKGFIELCAKLGLARNLRKVSPEALEKLKLKLMDIDSNQYEQRTL